MIYVISYFVIGLVLSLYWWNTDYKFDYEKAKTSDEGVEEGMAVLLLVILFTLWPIVLVVKAIRYFFNKA